MKCTERNCTSITKCSHYFEHELQATCATPCLLNGHTCSDGIGTYGKTKQFLEEALRVESDDFRKKFKVFESGTIDRYVYHAKAIHVDSIPEYPRVMRHAKWKLLITLPPNYIASMLQCSFQIEDFEKFRARWKVFKSGPADSFDRRPIGFKIADTNDVSEILFQRKNLHWELAERGKVELCDAIKFVSNKVTTGRMFCPNAERCPQKLCEHREPHDRLGNCSDSHICSPCEEAIQWRCENECDKRMSCQHAILHNHRIECDLTTRCLGHCRAEQLATRCLATERKLDALTSKEVQEIEARKILEDVPEQVREHVKKEFEETLRKKKEKPELDICTICLYYRLQGYTVKCKFETRESK